MGLSCGASFVKYGIFIFNLLIALAGIALITVGAIPLFKLGDIEAVFPENNPTIIPIIIVVLGSIIFFISFLGCCGAIRDNQCMVSSYAFFLLVIVVLQVVLAVFAFLYTSTLSTMAYDGFNRLFIQAQQNQEARMAVESIQRQFSCCGSDGPASWGVNIPDSCCDAGTQCSISNSFQTGCATTIQGWVEGSGLLIAWFAVVFAAIQLVGVVFACCLANAIRNADRRQYA